MEDVGKVKAKSKDKMSQFVSLETNMHQTNVERVACVLHRQCIKKILISSEIKKIAPRLHTKSMDQKNGGRSSILNYMSSVYPQQSTH